MSSPLPPDSPADSATGDDLTVSLSLRRILREMTPRLIATPALIALTFAGYVISAAGTDASGAIGTGALVRWGASYGPRVFDGEVWRLATTALLHAQPFHLASNLLALGLAGVFVERLVGPLGLALTYVLAAIGGALASALWHPAIVSVGASGAIYGLFGCLFGFYLVQRRRFPSGVLSIVAGGGAALLLHSAVQSMRPSVDWAGHLGGLVVGFACGALLVVPLDRRARALRARRARLTAAWVGAPLLLVALGTQALDGRPSLAARSIADADRAALAALATAPKDPGGLADAVGERVLAPLSSMTLPAPFAGLADDGLDATAGLLYRSRVRAWELLRAALDVEDPEGVAKALRQHAQVDARLVAYLTHVGRLDAAPVPTPVSVAVGLDALPSIGALARYAEARAAARAEEAAAADADRASDAEGEAERAAATREVEAAIPAAP